MGVFLSNLHVHVHELVSLTCTAITDLKKYMYTVVCINVLCSSIIVEA